MTNAETVASYRVIQPAAALNLIVLQSFTLLFTPAASRLFARGDQQGVKDLYWQTAAWVAVASFPIFALTFSLAEPLTVALYQERYASSAVYLAIIAIGRYFDAALGFNGLTVRVFGNVRAVVIVNLVAGALNLVLLLDPDPGLGGPGRGAGDELHAARLQHAQAVRAVPRLRDLDVRPALLSTSTGRSSSPRSPCWSSSSSLDPPLIVGLGMVAVSSCRGARGGPLAPAPCRDLPRARADPARPTDARMTADESGPARGRGHRPRPGQTRSGTGGRRRPLGRVAWRRRPTDGGRPRRARPPRGFGGLRSCRPRSPGSRTCRPGATRITGSTWAAGAAAGGGSTWWTGSARSAGPELDDEVTAAVLGRRDDGLVPRLHPDDTVAALGWHLLLDRSTLRDADIARLTAGLAASTAGGNGPLSGPVAEALTAAVTPGGRRVRQRSGPCATTRRPCPAIRRRVRRRLLDRSLSGRAARRVAAPADAGRAPACASR